MQDIIRIHIQRFILAEESVEYLIAFTGVPLCCCLAGLLFNNLQISTNDILAGCIQLGDLYLGYLIADTGCRLCCFTMTDEGTIITGKRNKDLMLNA